jgi:hypothetical protein
LTRRRTNPGTGGAIRTIGVSLLTVAAITAGVVFTKARHAPAGVEADDQKVVEAAPLDRLRAAGF